LVGVEKNKEGNRRGVSGADHSGHFVAQETAQKGGQNTARPTFRASAAGGGKKRRKKKKGLSDKRRLGGGCMFCHVTWGGQRGERKNKKTCWNVVRFRRRRGGKGKEKGQTFDMMTFPSTFNRFPLQQPATKRGEKKGAGSI